MLTSTPTVADLFPDSAPIDRAAPSDDARMNWPDVPAKCAIYLLTTDETSAGDNPAGGLLLATVGNLRAALQRRLSDLPPDAHSKRIPYGQLCTRVHWRIVHSQFAANWWYWNAARTLFPARYKELIPFRPAWWIALDRGSPYPEFRRTQDLSDSSSLYLGPIRDRTAAGKLISTLEDLFDLCRYHSILLQTPRGKPCAYKEMGKCPAPCDGSVPMSWYYGQLDEAWSFLTGESRDGWRTAQATSMKSAAAQLQFELAARIKARLARADLIDAEPYTHMRPLEKFSFLSFQPGQGKPWLEPWLVHADTGGEGVAVECLPQIKKKTMSDSIPELFERCKTLAATPTRPPLTAAATEQVAIVTHHLFRNNDAGVYIPLDQITTPEALTTRLADFFSRNTPAKPLTEQSSDQSAEIPAATEAPAESRPA